MLVAVLLLGCIVVYITSPDIRVKHCKDILRMSDTEARKYVYRPWYLGGLYGSRILMLGVIAAVYLATHVDILPAIIVVIVALVLAVLAMIIYARKVGHAKLDR